MNKTALIGSSKDTLKQIAAKYQQPAFRATQLYKWLHHHQATSFEAMTNLSKTFRQTLEADYRIFQLTLAQRQISTDGTRKYLWKLDDGNQVESVYIPETRRKTVCISSQVGCALGCAFCATAQMGFLKNLTAGDILEQVIRVQQDTGEKITNVVLMGMGEPFLNYNRVIDACRIMSDPEGLAISAKKITISTVGIVPRIRQFAEEQQPFSLAISLHAASQTLRSSIMPVAEKFDLKMLMDSAKYYSKTTGKRITFEYVLLAGVNDTPEAAKFLIRELGPLRCKLNLIPYNDTNLGFITPTMNQRQQFLDILAAAPFTVTMRKNRGNDITAACGQLFVDAASEKNRFMPRRQSADLKNLPETPA